MADESLILRSPYLQWLLVQLFPRLRQWPLRQWSGLLARAMAGNFDPVERLGILAGVAFLTWFLEPAAKLDAGVSFTFITQFLLALPLLALLAGPFFLRRIRRCLEAEARGAHDGKADIS